MVDADLEVRGAVMPLPEGGAVIMGRDDGASDWRPLLEVPPGQRPQLNRPAVYTYGWLGSR